MKVLLFVQLIALLCLVYPYFIYPFVLKLTPRRVKPSLREPYWHPKVYVVLCVHNAEDIIFQRIGELSSFNYNDFKLIVVDDGSTDGTMDEILRAMDHKLPPFQVLSTNGNIGKEAAQQLATENIPYKSDSIVVYTDAGSMLPKETLHRFVYEFQDRYVRAVSSRDVTVGGDGVYTRFEMRLRTEESKHAGIVGLSGSCFACHLSSSPFAPRNFPSSIIDYPSDFTTAMNVHRERLLAIQADIPVYYKAATTGEFARKRRTALRGMWTIKDHPYWIRKYGKYWTPQWAFQLHSHKTMRWLGPVFLIIAFPVIPVLALSSTGRHFLLTQAAFAAALFDLINGVKITKWTPTKRQCNAN